MVAESDDDAARRMSAAHHLGAVALSVCESLLISLQERGVLDQVEVDGLLEDVETAHRNCAADGEERKTHDAIAAIVQEIRQGGNSVRLLRKLRPPSATTAARPAGGPTPEEVAMNVTSTVEHEALEQRSALGSPHRSGDVIAVHPGNRVTMLETAFPVMIRLSTDGRHCVHVDQAWRRFIGRGEGAPDDWTSAVLAEDLEDCLELSAGAFEAQQPVSLDYRIRRHDGGVRWLREHASPVVDADGSLDSFCHVAIDITDIRADVDRLSDELELQRLMLRECRRRAGSHLQLVVSLLRLQAGAVSAAPARAALEAVAGRVEAIALGERQLDGGEGSAWIRLDRYLEAVTAPFEPLLADRGIALETDFGRPELPNEIAVPLALLVNEVLTNIVKHAFPDNRTGTVRLFASRGNSSLKLLISDDGIGLPKEAEARGLAASGLGLIRGFVAELGGELLIDRHSGTAYVISLPIDAERSQADHGAAPAFL